MQLVAQVGGALELESLARHFHVVSQYVNRAVVDSVKEGSRDGHALVVLAGAAGGYTRAEALLDLVADTARCPRLKLEQLALVTEVHAAVERAIAKPEHVV